VCTVGFPRTGRVGRVFRLDMRRRVEHSSPCVRPAAWPPDAAGSGAAAGLSSGSSCPPAGLLTGDGPSLDLPSASHRPGVGTNREVGVLLSPAASRLLG